MFLTNSFSGFSRAGGGGGGLWCCWGNGGGGGVPCCSFGGSASFLFPSPFCARMALILAVASSFIKDQKTQKLFIRNKEDFGVF